MAATKKPARIAVETIMSETKKPKPKYLKIVLHLEVTEELRVLGPDNRQRQVDLLLADAKPEILGQLGKLDANTH